MRSEAFEVLCCPACHGHLRSDEADKAELKDSELACTNCGRGWSIDGGVPDLVFPEELVEADAASRRLWDRIGRCYGLIGPLTNVIRGVSKERRELVGRLGLGSKSVALEIAAGTGENLRLMAEHLSGEGAAFGVDLSRRMIGRAERKLSRAGRSVTLVLGNAVRLPFRDGAFDAVLDGFGMKYYSDKPRAVREMLRVVKPGGKVVIAELGVPQKESLSVRQRLLRAWIPHFDEPPPLEAIPEAVGGLSVSWDAHETAYVIEFRKPETAAGNEKPDAG
jgi:SAM-dependent methyltransferase